MGDDQHPGGMTRSGLVGLAAAILVMTAGLYFGASAQSGNDGIGTAIVALLVSAALVVFAARGFPHA